LPWFRSCFLEDKKFKKIEKLKNYKIELSEIRQGLNVPEGGKAAGL